tara:strand:- start:146 stop:847 length:702 start_codon:yes stop_codon:yes gene_type:complete
MNTISLQISSSKKKIFNNVKMLVFDMAGTTINERGIVYDTLYDTIKNFGLNISRSEINKWHGSNKYEVLNHYLNKDNVKVNESIKIQLHNNFDNNLKERYFYSSSIDLIDPNIPVLFNKIREKDIKIALNTGYSKDIQDSIIKKLRMNEFIDDYISSDQVKLGRPEPFMINKLMEQNNIFESKSVIKFGDTQNDILEGINANCLASIGVLSGADCEKKLSNSDYILESVMNIY